MGIRFRRSSASVIEVTFFETLKIRIEVSDPEKPDVLFSSKEESVRNFNFRGKNRSIL